MAGTKGDARAHLGSRLDDGLHAHRERRGRRRGLVPTVIPSTGYGTEGWIRVLGRVVLTRPGPDDDAPAPDSRVRGWRSFTSVPVRDAEVTVVVGGVRTRLRADRGGVIDQRVPADLAPGWRTVQLIAGDERPIDAPVFVVGSDVRFGVVSDIDDTVMVTALPRPFLAAWNTFVLDEHARAPVPGMAVLYDRVLREHPGAPMVYLSTGAWNTAPTLTRFLRRNLYPRGALLLTDWGPTTDRWFRSGVEHKRSGLARLVEEFPWVHWLLVGDDGQNDPRLYGELASAHPDRVAAIAIRSLTTGEAVLAGRRHEATDAPGDDVPRVTAPDGAGLFARLLELGVVTATTALPRPEPTRVGGRRDTGGVRETPLRRLARLRITAQGLSAPSRSARGLTALRRTATGLPAPTASPVEAVRRLLAVQAQDAAAGAWAVGVRSPGSTAADVDRELDEGGLVRSWPMRGTLHLIAAEDLGWLGPLGRERVNASVQTRHRQLGLDAATLDRAESLTSGLLADGRMTRTGLLDALDERGLDTSGQRGAHLIGWLARHEVLVLASGRTIAAFAERVPHPRRLDREAALAELADRYLAGHGPATDRDLAWWSGLTLADARAGIEAVRDRVESLEIDGATYFHAPGLTAAPPGALALPSFDELALGYTDRRAALGVSDLSRLVPGKNGMFLASLVIDGEIAATWRREGSRILLDPWRDLPPSRAGAIRAAFARWARFTGRSAVLEL